MTNQLIDYLENSYRTQRRQFLTYSGIFAVAILIGLWSAWFFRGKIDFSDHLVFITLGYSIPAFLIIWITWRASKRFIVVSQELEFLNGILICVVISVFMQWAFFQMGFMVFGTIDYNKAAYLCEQSKKWAQENVDQIRFRITYLDKKLPSGRPIDLGNISRPRLIHIQKRTYEGEESIENEIIKSAILCRFYDPRYRESDPRAFNTYNYVSETWLEK